MSASTLGTLSTAYLDSAVASVVTGAALGLLAALPLVAVAGPLGAVVGLVAGVFCGPVLTLPPHLLADLLTRVVCPRARTEGWRALVTGALVAGLLVAAAVALLLGVTGAAPWPSAPAAVAAAGACGTLGRLVARVVVPADDFHRGGRPG